MSRFDNGDRPTYVAVAERRRQAEREAAKLRKKGQILAPVRIEGRAIATTACGKAWCGNLERYRDYESRLPRGRTYVRNGSVIGLQVGTLLAGAILTETIFSWPGLGRWLIEALQRRDYPVVQGGVLLTAVLIIVVNLLVDLLYGVVNPRIRHKK